MTGWVRLWSDMPSDPKWRVIARKSGRSIAEVIAVFNFMMVCAGDELRTNGDDARTHGNAGNIGNFNDEDVAIALGIDEENVLQIRNAMEGKVLANRKLLGWRKRQPLREDNSTERTRAWRERNRTQCDAIEQNRTELYARAREAPSEVAPPLASRKTWPSGRTNGHANEDVLMPTKFTPAELERHKQTHKIYVKRETPAGDAWAKWTQKNTGHSQVWDAKGGWYFPSELPPPSPSEN